MTVSHSRCELFYIQISRRECVWNYESNMRCVYTSQSPTNLHRCTNSFITSRTRARVCVSYIRTRWVRVAIWVQIADAQRGSLLYAPKLVCTWYRPRDRMTRFNASPLPVPLEPLPRPRLLVPVLWRVRVDHANPLGLIWFVLSYRALRYLLSHKTRSDDCQDCVQRILKVY